MNRGSTWLLALWGAWAQQANGDGIQWGVAELSVRHHARVAMVGSSQVITLVVISGTMSERKIPPILEKHLGTNKYSK